MKHLLPALPYDTAALEPHIDARTVALHHGLLRDHTATNRWAGEGELLLDPA